MFEQTNFDDVFTRNVIVGLCSFFYDMVKVPQIVDNKTEYIDVPFFYSMTGGNNSDQYMQDLYMDTDKYCKVLSPKIDGNTSRIPSAVISLGSSDISQENVGAGYTRVDFQKEFNTEFSKELRDMSARGDFIPMNYSFEVIIKCSSEIQRQKIYEIIIKKFYKQKKFWIRYQGFNKLPVNIGFPDSYDMEKNFQWRFADNEKRPQIKFAIELLAWMPVIHENTERFSSNNINTFNADLTAVRTDDNCDDETIDPNNDYKLDQDNNGAI